MCGIAAAAPIVRTKTQSGVQGKGRPYNPQKKSKKDKENDKQANKVKMTNKPIKFPSTN
jgi:hypothetical protein